jgi:hypothetical protein
LNISSYCGGEIKKTYEDFPHVLFEPEETSPLGRSRNIFYDTFTTDLTGRRYSNVD